MWCLFHCANIQKNHLGISPLNNESTDGDLLVAQEVFTFVNGADLACIYSSLMSERAQNAVPAGSGLVKAMHLLFY